MDTHPEPYVIEPQGGKHTHTLILLHGTSTSGPEFGEAFLDFPFSIPTALLEDDEEGNQTVNEREYGVVEMGCVPSTPRITASISPQMDRDTDGAETKTKTELERKRGERKDSVWDDQPPSPSSPPPPPPPSSHPPTQKTRHTTLRQELHPGGLLASVKIIFPTGSLKPTTVFGGRKTHAWFDIHTFSDRTIGEEGMRGGMGESCAYLRGLIEREGEIVAGVEGPIGIVEERERETGTGTGRGRGRGRGWGWGKVWFVWLKGMMGSKEGKERRRENERARKRVMIGGFSQGSAMAVVGFLAGEFEVGGLWGVSGWLPFRKQIVDLNPSAPPSNTGTVSARLPGLSFWERMTMVSLAPVWLLSSGYLALLGTVGLLRRDEGEDRRRQVMAYLRDLFYLPTKKGLALKANTPIFLAHGTADRKVRYEWAVQMCEALASSGFQVREGSYEGVEHEFCEEGMRDFVDFVREFIAEEK